MVNKLSQRVAALQLEIGALRNPPIEESEQIKVARERTRNLGKTKVWIRKVIW